MSISSEKIINADILKQKYNISIETIYKVNQLVNGSVDTIYIFNINKEIIEQILKNNDEIDFFKILFSNEDEILKKIQDKKIDLHFSTQQIHSDDNIATIKIKIVNELKNILSLDEIYLYCQKKETLNSIDIYESLTRNKKVDLTKTKLDQFFSNVFNVNDMTSIQIPEEKGIYTYNDILEMKIDNNTYIVNKILGQKYFLVEDEYPFVCNPYDLNEFDKLFEKSIRKSLSSLNSNLLLNSGEILNNNIYLCRAKDVLDFFSKKQILEETVVKVYYPYLYSKNIYSLEDLEDNSEKLIENNNKFINKKTLEVFKTVDTFYDIYNLRKSELEYQSKGIKFIKAIIKPDFDIKIPLEIIFKIIHASKTNPLIKFNPASKQENIYRLYAEQLSTDGRKIPFLNKGTIFKLVKSIARTKSVSVYIELEGTKPQTIICEFDENGFITVTCEFKNAVSADEVDQLFKSTLNPIIEEIKNLLEQSGYKLKLFNSLKDTNLEIKQLTYETQIDIKKPFDIDSFKGCISSIFINETNIRKGGILLRFKRVSNFNKVTSQEAFILEKSQQGYRGFEIIDALLDNFKDDLTREQATDLVRKVANEIQTERGVRKSDIKIKDNPGFKTTIAINSETAVITINVENINDINYLKTIPIYLDTIVRLTQDKSSTSYSIQDINSLCSKGEKEDIKIPEIVNSESESDNEININDEDEEEEYERKFKNLIGGPSKSKLNLFYDDANEGESDSEDNKSKGGTKTESDSSVSSAESSPESLKPLAKAKPDTDSSVSSAESSPEPLAKSKPDTDSSVSSAESSPESSPESLKPLKKATPESDSSVSSAESSPESLKPLAKATPESDSSVSSAISSAVKEVVKTLKKATPDSDGSVSDAFDTPKPLKNDKEDDNSSVLSEVSSAVSSVVKTAVKNAVKTAVKSITPSGEDESESHDKEKQIPEKQILEKQIPEKQIPEKQIPEKPKTKIFYESASESEPEETNEKENDESEPENKDVESEEDESEEDEEDLKNINNKVLSSSGKKTNYFQELIEKKDPVLILKQDKGQFKAYSRTYCSTHRRQPVILTDKQLEDIKKEHPDFLQESDVIKYGSDPKNEFNYICPRYWCLKTNKPIDPKELKQVKGIDGKIELKHPSCGKVLPMGEKKVKNGYYIYQFYGENDKRYPGLQTDTHPDGYCLPCCFDKYNKAGRIATKEYCSGKISKAEFEAKKGKKPKDEDKYILGPEKFPLDPGRWGYLPIEVQQFLNETNSDCQFNKQNTVIKSNQSCLLRHGIEVNQKQSFIACISDMIFFAKKITDAKDKSVKTSKILSIKEMRERISESITIDSFITYQNGNLVTDFQDPNIEIDKTKYKNSKLYKKINLDNKEEETYFIRVASALENFKLFLSDDNAIIDHTYLWDIVSMPNKNLFEKGLNLVILQLPNDDITNNIQLLCPTNHYSNEFYNTLKPTIFLIKEEGYYEPIYSYSKKSEASLTIMKEFKQQNPHLSSTIKEVLIKIKEFYDEICKPLESMPNVYKAKHALVLNDLLEKLRGKNPGYNYTILKLVVNFNNKVIGVISTAPNGAKTEGFIPCYPSAINYDLGIDTVFMTDPSLWNEYKETVTFLNKLSDRSKLKKKTGEPDIHCKPAFKIIEDDLVVGILTETNQFIQLSKPISEFEIDESINLPSIDNENYIIKPKDNPMVNTDTKITTNDGVDVERVEFIKKIKLETNFYNVFRNTVRILINDYENIKIREDIERETKNQYIIYSEKLKKIDKYLRQLCKDKVGFTGDKNYYKVISEVSTCIIKNEDKCKESKLFCAVTNGNCKLIIPKKNLITDKENETIYYGKMADEIIRYSRINSFMFQPQTYLSFGNIGYNLKDDEIILLQSSLTQSYFENLTPTVKNEYVQYNSYDEVEPIKTQTYENTISSLEKKCNKVKNTKIVSQIWHKCFPENYGEIEYGASHFCTFSFIIDLIERKINKKLSVNQIKNELYEEYKKYLDDYKDKIIYILMEEGKKILGNKAKSGLSFDSIIYSDDYFLSTLDLWLLVQKYKIPTIFISKKFILQTKYEKNEFVGYSDDDDNNYAFIQIPAYRDKTIPGLKLIISNDKEVFFSLDKLQEVCTRRIQTSLQNKLSIKDYLEELEPLKKTDYQSKKPKGIIPEKPIKKRGKLVIENPSPPPTKKRSKLVIENPSPEINEDEPIVENPIPENLIKKKGKLVIENPSPEKNEKPKKTRKTKPRVPKNSSKKNTPSS